MLEAQGKLGYKLRSVNLDLLDRYHQPHVNTQLYAVQLLNVRPYVSSLVALLDIEFEIKPGMEGHFYI